MQLQQLPRCTDRHRQATTCGSVDSLTMLMAHKYQANQVGILLANPTLECGRSTDNDCLTILSSMLIGISMKSVSPSALGLVKFRSRTKSIYWRGGSTVSTDPRRVRVPLLPVVASEVHV